MYLVTFKSVISGQQGTIGLTNTRQEAVVLADNATKDNESIHSSIFFVPNTVTQVKVNVDNYAKDNNAADAEIYSAASF